MVKHMVFWNLREDCDKDVAAAQMREALERLVGIVPGLQSAEVRRCYSGYDVALYSELTDRAAVEGYQVHPEHLAAKEIVHRYAIARVSCDYEV
ncbi:MAG: Dabb family protein [Pygmaiobacter sp.]